MLSGIMRLVPAAIYAGPSFYYLQVDNIKMSLGMLVVMFGLHVVVNSDQGKILADKLDEHDRKLFPHRWADDG